jgi:O-antigen/teichoic acid export membrane protein
MINPEKKLLPTALAVFTIRAAGLCLGFIVALLSARWLGAEQYGLFAYAVAWSSLIAIPASLGLPEYLLREAARKHGTHAGINLKKWAESLLLKSSFVGAAILLLIGWAISNNWEEFLIYLLLAPLPFLQNCSAIRQSILRATGYVINSQWPQTILAPILCIIGIFFLHITGYLSPFFLVAVYLLTAFIILALNEKQITSFFRSSQNTQGNITRSFSFALIGALYFINSKLDLIMVGSLMDQSSTGVYAIVSRIAELIAFPLLITNLVIGPRISDYFHMHNTIELQTLITKSSRLTFLLIIPLSYVIIYYGCDILEIFFGAEFTAGSSALTVLAAGQCFNVACGSVGLILAMCNRENIAVFGVGFAVCANLLLNLFLIPRWGMVGAAAATSISLIVWNILLWIMVKKTLNLRPSILSM